MSGEQITLAKLIELRRALPPVSIEVPRATLSERFLLPPFSVLDARQGYWQKRKRMWLDIGMTYGQRISESQADFHEKDCLKYRNKANGNFSFSTKVELRSGRCFNMGMDGKDADNENNSRYSTPVFDPVLCELAYRWFCPPDGHIVDPFAGTALSGIVAAKIGRRYTGIDINPQQMEQNRAERDLICPNAPLEWIAGDSTNAQELLGEECDLLFSCPPYGDLVRYSDDPCDISTMDYDQFLESYCAIIRETCLCLRQDRFAVYVVADFRDPKTGAYRGFVGHTVDAFRDAGMELYNDAVLVTAIGSLPIRVGKQFTSSRKLGKTHQNVLVFLKGDALRAVAACGEVDINDLEMPECVEGSVVLCRQDVAGTMVEEYLMNLEEEVSHIYLPPTESYLMCDILRGNARSNGTLAPRVWVGTADGWVKVEDNVYLTHIIGNIPYLNRVVFPEAVRPADRPPEPKRMK